MLEYMDALYLKAVKSQNSVRESLCSSFVSLLRLLQTFIALKIAVVSMSVDDAGRKALSAFCRSIS